MSLFLPLFSLSIKRHFPYLQDPKKRDNARYFNSLKSTDEFLQGIFDTLASYGQLENTIIVGSSDHGEDPFKSNYVRLSALNSNILHTTSYIYYPENLRRGTDIGQRLRANTQQLVHTLDMFPTIQSILHGGYDYWANKEHTGCATGIDLTSVDIPDDRVTISQNLASSLGFRGEPPRYWAIETKDNARRVVSSCTCCHKLNLGELYRTVQLLSCSSCLFRLRS